MKKLFMMIGLVCVFFAQDSTQDDMDQVSTDTKEASVCGFVDKTTPFDSFKYEADLAMGFKIWYSDAYSAAKKWRTETDPDRKSNFADKLIKASWQILVSDPDGLKEKRLSKRGTVKLIVLVAERLGEVYIENQDLDMLGTLLARMEKFIGNSSKLNKYAVTYYNATEQNQCEADQYAAWISTIEKNEENKENLKILYKAYMNVLSQMNNNKEAVAKGEEYLAFDPSDTDMLEYTNSFKGDITEILASYKAKLQEDPNDMMIIERAAPLAAELDENEDAYKWYLMLLAKDPKNVSYLRKLTRISFKLEKHANVIKYGRNLKDVESQELLIKSYSITGQFQMAYNVASAVQKTDRALGHYLKGLVYEETANAAQNDATIGKKDFEWRLIYRLSNIEYLMGGPAGSERASKINQLIPSKGDLFLKAERIKPQAGKFSDWITWQSSYDKVIYGPTK
jgi:hypothetical protein